MSGDASGTGVPDTLEQCCGFGQPAVADELQCISHSVVRNAGHAASFPGCD
jgi:hypothetical protein